MHIGVTNCYWGLWGNLISGSVLNQLFISGVIVMHLVRWDKLISAKLIVQWCLTDCSTVKLNGRGDAGPVQWYRNC